MYGDSASNSNHSAMSSRSTDGADGRKLSYDFHLTAEGNRVLGSWLGTQIQQLLQTGRP
jgi:hypothetical protein